MHFKGLQARHGLHEQPPPEGSGLSHRRRSFPILSGRSPPEKILEICSKTIDNQRRLIGCLLRIEYRSFHCRFFLRFPGPSVMIGSRVPYICQREPGRSPGDLPPSQRARKVTLKKCPEPNRNGISGTKIFFQPTITPFTFLKNRL